MKENGESLGGGTHSQMRDAVRATIDTYNKSAKEYAENMRKTELVAQRQFFLENLNGDKVLDIGCAAGWDSKFFYKAGLNVIGIDLSENFLEMARKENKGIPFIKMDMLKLDFPKESFDGLWVCASFLHLPKKDTMLALGEFKRVLRKEGLLYLCVKKGKGTKIIKGRFFAFYQEEELLKLLDSVGFRKIKLFVERQEGTSTDWINIFCKIK